MKQHLNTLYVTTQGTYLAREGDTILARIESETRLRLPLNTLESVACFGRVSMSPALMGTCGKRGIGVSFFSLYGRYLARIVGPESGNVLLRRAQYRGTDDPAIASQLARSVVIGKVANARGVLQRHLRDHPNACGRAEVSEAVQRLARVIERLAAPIVLDSARGLEGDAARVYFGVLDHLIIAQKDGFRFAGRNRRPPRDPVNALLSFVYSLLLGDVLSACQGVGLDPQVGYLHRERPGRPSLALDLMEELRAVLADRLVLSLINRKQIQAGSFEETSPGEILLEDSARRAVLKAYQERKLVEVVHPFLKEKMTTGTIPHIQASLLARHLRGDLDAYPPYIWR